MARPRKIQTGCLALCWLRPLERKGQLVAVNQLPEWKIHAYFRNGLLGYREMISATFTDRELGSATRRKGGRAHALILEAID